MGEQKVLKRVVNHVAKNSVKELSIVDGAQQHMGRHSAPYRKSFISFYLPQSLRRVLTHRYFFAGEKQELLKGYKYT